MNRMIWLAYFLVGGAMLAQLVAVMDAWALATALPGTEQYCRGTLVATVPLTRAPLCFAVWFTEAKSWVFYLHDMLFQLRPDLYAHELLRTADVALFAIGGIAAGLTLACLWATSMTRVTCSAIAGSYTLLFGLSHMLGGRRHA